MTQETENPITTALVKENVTEKILKQIKDDFLPLKINGIDDKEGYKKVHEARMTCVKLRTTTEKICKKGREEAVKVQKEWLAKEKEVIAQITPVEEHLKKQEAAIDAEIEAQKIRAERLLKLPGRKEQVVGIEDYVLTVIQSSSLLKSYPFPEKLTDELLMVFDDTIWNQVIINAKDKKIQEFEEKERIRKEQEKQEKLVLRQNEIYKVGAIAVTQNGRKEYNKGKISLPEMALIDMPEEQWTDFLVKLANIQEETPAPEMKNVVTAEVKQYPKTPSESFPPRMGESNTDERSDEEKLFYFAGCIEEFEPPVMKTEEGKKVLAEAMELITKAINILRQ